MSKETKLNYRVVMVNPHGTVMGYAEDFDQAYHLAKSCAMYMGYIAEVQALPNPEWKTLARITDPVTKRPTSPDLDTTTMTNK